MPVLWLLTADHYAETFVSPNPQATLSRRGSDVFIAQNTNEGLTKAMEFMVEVIGSLAVLFAASVIVAPVILGLILLVLFLKKRKRKRG